MEKTGILSEDTMQRLRPRDQNFISQIFTIRKPAGGRIALKLLFCALLLWLLPFTTSFAQQRAPDVKWLIKVLNLEKGSVVADIGAGEGDQTLALARFVGAGGKVYSSELGYESEQRLRKRLVSEPNVVVIEGGPRQTHLPVECCDAVFLRRVYHHFDDPAPMNKSIWQSLKPGGRLAVIDFEPRGSESEDPEGRDQDDHHGVTAETVVEELKQAGFRLISSEQRSGRNIYVVVEKPGDN